MQRGMYEHHGWTYLVTLGYFGLINWAKRCVLFAFGHLFTFVKTSSSPVIIITSRNLQRHHAPRPPAAIMIFGSYG